MYFYYSLTHETQLKTLILKLSDPNLTSSLRRHVHDESLIYKEMTYIEYFHSIFGLYFIIVVNRIDRRSITFYTFLEVMPFNKI